MDKNANKEPWGIYTKRIALGLSRADVKELLGIPERTLQNWELGTREPAEWLEQMVIRELERVGNKKDCK